MRTAVIQKIRYELAQYSAAAVADFFLSPNVSEELLLTATADEGPSLWIVNRSDVFDETLEMLQKHPVTAIAARAKEKLSLRKSKLLLLEPPELPAPLEQIPDYEVEDVIGHPLVPLEAIAFFAKHSNDDIRASSILSFLRRTLEHTPNWNFDLALKFKFQSLFYQMLLGDSSPFVRSYAARVPLLDSTQLMSAFNNESHPLVKAKILQNPNLNRDTLLLLSQINFSHSQIDQVLALDKRLTPDHRTKILRRTSNPLVQAVHEWYLDSTHFQSLGTFS